MLRVSPCPYHAHVTTGPRANGRDRRHPIFARKYLRFSARVERAGATAHREEALAGLSGRVIEVGAGSGLNFVHYPPSVEEVVAVEPEAYLRTKAEQEAARAPVPVTVTDGVADALPVPDATCDAGVASLVPCSVADQAAAPAELRRVIRPGGELRFYEHVKARDARWARRQDRIDRIWPIFGGGCHCNRDTLGPSSRRASGSSRLAAPRRSIMARASCSQLRAAPRTRRHDRNRRVLHRRVRAKWSHRTSPGLADWVWSVSAGWRASVGTVRHRGSVTGYRRL
jgi:SAM-dependent methyltransferase